MKINFAPESNLGKLSIGLIVAVPVLLFIGMSLVGFYDSVPAGNTIPQDILARPLLALSMLAGFVSGISAFFCGIISVLRNKDYSVPVFVSTALGFFVLLWVFAEIFFPH